MFKHMTNTNTLRAVLLTAAIAVLAFFVSVPAGAKDKPLSKRELKNLIARAETKADHEKLAAYYRSEAARLKAKQEDHEEEAAEYFKNPSSHPGPKYPTLGQHCRDLAGYYKMGAQKAIAMAEMHEGMANNK